MLVIKAISDLVFVVEALLSTRTDVIHAQRLSPHLAQQHHAEISKEVLEYVRLIEKYMQPIKNLVCGTARSGKYEISVSS